jgi:hypothetical protein
MTSFISIFGYIMFFHLIFQGYLEYLPAIIIAGIVSILYLMGLGNHLFQGAQALFWAGIIFFIVSLILLLFKDKRRGLKALSPGIVIFLLSFLLGYLALQGAHYRNWDEFSHWGLASKEMLFTNSLAKPGGAVQFLDYPPGISLFHYFFLLNSPMEMEAGTYIAHLVLLLAPLTIFFYRIEWRDWKKILLILLIVPCIVVTLGNGFRSIYSDQLLSVYSAALIIGYVRLADGPKCRMLLLLPIFFLLPMIKKTGYLLCWFAIFMFFADQVLSALRPDGDGNGKGPHGMVMEGVKGLAIVAILAATCWLFEYTWKVRIGSLHLPETFSMPFDIKGVLSAFTDAASPFTKEVIAKFRARTMVSFLSPANLLSGHIFFISAIFWAFRKGRPWLARRTFLFYLMFLFFLAVYTFGLLYMYLFSFTPDLAATLSSYDRYMNIFYAAFCLAGFGFFLMIDWIELDYRWFWGCFLGLLLLMGWCYWSFMGSPHPDYSQVAQDRKGIEAMVRAARTVINGRDRVYLVIQGDEGFKFRMLKYELSPQITQTWCWRLGREKHKWDVCNCDKTVEQWSDVLKKWDYVLIADGDEELWERYGRLFCARGALLYKVTNKKGPLVKLVPAVLPEDKTHEKYWRHLYED